MVALVSREPDSSKHTTLQPVLNPGSMARMRLEPTGGANNNCRRLVEKTLIASLSAFSFASFSTSFSKEGHINRVQASLQVSATKSAQASSPFTKNRSN